MAFAGHEFRLGKRDKAGVSLRETLLTVERLTGKMPKEGVNPTDLPEATRHVWAWFLLMNNSRQSSGTGGPMPLSNMEILAFFQLEQFRPEGWELAALRLLDQVALAPPGDDE